MKANANDPLFELWRWLLRECVRANPFYVVSAMFLAYAVLQLNAEIDPQVGKAGGALAILALLQFYELAVLGVAALVLIKRPGGGRDMHGLTLVAAIFLCGSFNALDELANTFPQWRFALLGGALFIAACKLECYARLPGILLPARYRIAMLLILCVHSLPAMLAKCDALDARSCAVKQGVAWLAGWASLLPLSWLAWRDGEVMAATAATKGLTGAVIKDPLATRRCAGVAIGIVAVLSCVHLISGDWISDRPFDLQRLVPDLWLLTSAAIVLHWRQTHALGTWATVLSCVPLLALLKAAITFNAQNLTLDWPALLGAETQTCAAALAFYMALAWATGLKRFYFAPLAACVLAALEGFAKIRATIPYLRSIAAAALGFALLLLGLCVSLYREWFLRWLDLKPKKIDGPNQVS